jgi:hypothetical protein
LEGIHKAILTGAIDPIDQGFAILLRGKLVDVDVDVDHLAHLRARPHGRRLDRHALLVLTLNSGTDTCQ